MGAPRAVVAVAGRPWDTDGPRPAARPRPARGPPPAVDAPSRLARPRRRAGRRCRAVQGVAHRPPWPGPRLRRSVPGRHRGRGRGRPAARVCSRPALIVAAEAIVLPASGRARRRRAGATRSGSPCSCSAACSCPGCASWGCAPATSTEEARAAERAARVAAERSAGRATALAELSAALNQGLTRDAIVREALRTSIRVVGADRGAFFVARGGRRGPADRGLGGVPRCRHAGLPVHPARCAPARRGGGPDPAAGARGRSRAVPQRATRTRPR